MASTNQYEFLTDETGNVRWLVFNILEINHDNGKENGYSQKVDIDLVWGQAYYLLMNGFEYDMTKDEISQQEILNRSFIRKSAEMDAINQLYLPAKEDDERVEFKTAFEIQNELNTTYKQNFNKHNIGRALQTLGFVQKSVYRKDIQMSVKSYLIKKVNFLIT